MALVAHQKKKFRAIGHKLNPIVTIAGNGLSEAVLSELDRALEDHELIKVKLAVGDRELKKEVIKEMLTAANAELVQAIGNIALIYRAAKDPKPNLSNILKGF